MPIILPKCPENYELFKEKCRCKKKPKVKTVKVIKINIKKNKKNKTVKKIKVIKINIKKRKTKSKKQLKKRREKQTKKKKKTAKNPLLPIQTQMFNPPPTYDINDFKTLNINPNIHTINPTQFKSQLISRLRSYSPEVNREITRMEVTPYSNLFGFKCKENQISHNSTCHKWTSKKAEDILLHNLKSKKKIIAENILGPNQYDANCWFNTFFMIFFITDKGRKFMKNFRRTMITGKIDPKGKKKLPPKLRYPFWLLNKFIEASLIGKKDPSLYASLMDTNDIIQQINKNLSRSQAGFYKKTGEGGNPVEMFIRLLRYFSSNTIPFFQTSFGLKTIDYNNCNYNEFQLYSQKSSWIYKLIVKEEPDILIIDMSDKNGGNNEYSVKLKRMAKVSDYKKKLIYNFGNLQYKLNSAGIRDTKQEHICGCLTINGDEYIYDGENHTPLYKKKWTHLLNKNKTFKITPDILEKYNFTKSYQCLIYYRTK